MKIILYVHPGIGKLSSSTRLEFTADGTQVSLISDRKVLFHLSDVFLCRAAPLSLSADTMYNTWLNGLVSHAFKGGVSQPLIMTTIFCGPPDTLCGSELGTIFGNNSTDVVGGGGRPGRLLERIAEECFEMVREFNELPKEAHNRRTAQVEQPLEIKHTLSIQCVLLGSDGSVVDLFAPDSNDARIDAQTSALVNVSSYSLQSPEEVIPIIDAVSSALSCSDGNLYSVVVDMSVGSYTPNSGDWVRLRTGTMRFVQLCPMCIDQRSDGVYAPLHRCISGAARGAPGVGFSKTPLTRLLKAALSSEAPGQLIAMMPGPPSSTGNPGIACILGTRIFELCGLLSELRGVSPKFTTPIRVTPATYGIGPSITQQPQLVEAEARTVQRVPDTAPLDPAQNMDDVDAELAAAQRDLILTQKQRGTQKQLQYATGLNDQVPNATAATYPGGFPDTAAAVLQQRASGMMEGFTTTMGISNIGATGGVGGGGYTSKLESMTNGAAAGTKLKKNNKKLREELAELRCSNIALETTKNRVIAEYRKAQESIAELNQKIDDKQRTIRYLERKLNSVPCHPTNQKQSGRGKGKGDNGNSITNESSPPFRPSSSGDTTSPKEPRANGSGGGTAEFIADLHTTIAQLEAQLRTAKQEIMSAQESGKGAEGEMSAMKQELEELRERNRTVEEEKNKLQEQNKQLGMEMKGKVEAVEEMFKTRLNQMSQQQKQQLNHSPKRLQDTTAASSEAPQTLAVEETAVYQKLLAENATLRAQLQENEKVMRVQLVEISSKDTEIVRLGAAVREQTERAEVLQKSLESAPSARQHQIMVRTIQELRKRLGEMTSRVTELEGM